MSVTAKFIADFTSFYDAVQKAEVELRGFEDGAGRVEKQLNRTADAFSGRKVLQEATLAAKAIEDIGGASKLTENEQTKVNALVTEALAKYRALGQEAPAALLELQKATKAPAEQTDTLNALVGRLTASYLSVEGALAVLRGAFDFAKDAIASAAAIEDLSQATGVSTRGLQQLGYVGEGVGIDMETMARAVETFSAKVAGGDASAQSAVEKLGLNLHELLAMGPERAFVAFADAASRVQDPMDKAAIYTEAFGGRIGRTLLALGDLSKAMSQVPEFALISDETIQRADAFDDAIKHATTTLKAFAVEAIDGVIQGTGLLNTQFNLLGQAVLGLNASLADSGAAMKGHDIYLATEIDHVKLLQNRLTALRKDAVEPLTESQKLHIIELDKGGTALKEIADLVGSNVTAVKLYIDAQKEAVRVDELTAEAHAKLAAELAKNRDDQYATDVQKATNAANAKYAIAVAEAKKKHITDQSYYDDLEKLRQEDIAKAQVDGDLLAKNSIANLEAIRDKAAQTWAAMAGSGLNFTDKFKMQLAFQKDATAAAVDGITLDWDKYYNYSNAKLQEKAKNEKALLDEMLAHAWDFSRGAIDAQRAIADDAKEKATSWGNPWNDQFKQAQAQAEATAQAAKKAFQDAVDAIIKDQQKISAVFTQTYDLSTPEGMAFFRQMNPGAVFYGDATNPDYFRTHTLEDAIRAGLVDLYGAYHAGNAPHAYANGGTDVPGGWAMVGERGPEMVRLPAGSDVIPHDQLGQTINVTVNVSGAVLGTQQQLADLISSALMTQQQGQGRRFRIGAA